MPILHYALQPSGFLLLGKAESVAAFPDFFTSVDKKHKIYMKKVAKSRLHYDFSPNHYPKDKGIAAPAKELDGASLDLIQQQEADRIVLKKYAPSSLVINEKMEVFQFRGFNFPERDFWPE